MKNETSENRRKFIIYQVLKIVHESGNGDLQIFSSPQVIKNSRKYLLLRTDILKKKVVGCS